MTDDISNYEVKDEEVSDEEWETFLSAMQKKGITVENQHSEHRTKQDPIPVNLSDYLNKLQFASIKKLQNFGWELFFIRRSDKDDIKTVMHFPSSGATAVIEEDGTVNKTHNIHIRKAQSVIEPDNSIKTIDEEKSQLDGVIERDDGTFEVQEIIFNTKEEAKEYMFTLQSLRLE